MGCRVLSSSSFNLFCGFTTSIRMETQVMLVCDVTHKPRSILGLLTSSQRFLMLPDKAICELFSYILVLSLCARSHH